MTALDEYAIEGAERKSKEVIKNILTKFPNLSNKEIAEIVAVPISFVEKVKKEFLEKE